MEEEHLPVGVAGPPRVVEDSRTGQAQQQGQGEGQEGEEEGGRRKRRLWGRYWGEMWTWSAHSSHSGKMRRSLQTRMRTTLTLMTSKQKEGEGEGVKGVKGV